MNSRELRLPAIRIIQSDQEVFSFGVEGRRVHEFAAISRVHRTELSDLAGYQRPEVQSHIKSIRRYLQSPGAILPNAIVLAFDGRISFTPTSEASVGQLVTPGILSIPLDDEWQEEEKPAWLVDGQQRSAALRDADLDNFAVAVVGFRARNEAEQRAQFILVNNTKPLPRGLIHELLPETSTQLPAVFARKRLPSTILSRLNQDPNSVFFHRISTPTSPLGYIKDNSVLKMIENSLYDGALYQYRDPVSGDGDIDEMARHLNHYWDLVVQVFPTDWELPPRKSRLTHGAGIQSMGYVMDSLTEGTNFGPDETGHIFASLGKLSKSTAWSSGTWRFSETEILKWNAIQNTPNDVKKLTSYLLSCLRD